MRGPIEVIDDRVIAVVVVICSCWSLTPPENSLTYIPKNRRPSKATAVSVRISPKIRNKNIRISGTPLL